MKCPSCQHISDTALVKCSECGTVYDRAALEEFQHLEYLLRWLNAPERANDPQAEVLDQLYAEALSQLNAVRAEMGLPPIALPVASPSLPVAPPPTVVTPSLAPSPPSLPVAARSPEEIARELSLVEALLKQVQDWGEASGLGLIATRDLHVELAARAEALKTELAGRSAPIEPPSDLEVIDFAIASLPPWTVASLRYYLNRKRAELARPAQPPSAAPAPPTPVSAAQAEPELVITLPSLTPPVASALVTKPARQPVAPPSKPAPPPKPPAPPIDWAKAWERAWGLVVSGALLRGLLYLGAFMFVVSVVVLVVVYWRYFHPLLQIGFVASMPLAFYAGGFWLRTRLKIPVAGGVFTGTGALLVAVDFAAVYQLGGLAGRVNVNAYWLAASLVSTAIYIFTAWRIPREFFGYITLVGAASTVLALTRILRLPLEWEIASVAASGAGMAGGAILLRRATRGWDHLALAARRLPQILIPATLAVVLFVPGKPAWGQMGAFLFVSLAYGLLAWGFPAAVFAHASVWSSIGAAGFALLAAGLRAEWYASVSAALAPLYISAGRGLARRLPEDFVRRRSYLTAIYAAGFGLTAIAIVAGLISLLVDLWAGILALALAALVLAWCAYLFRRPALAFFASGLFIAPFSLAIARRLLDAREFQWFAWLMAAWAGLALVYLGLAVILRRAEKYGAWLNLWAHVLAPLGALGLLANYGFTSIDWRNGPTLVGLAGIILVYLASAILHDTGRHPALSGFVNWLPARLARAIFLWPMGFLLPVWMAVAWWGSVLDRQWLGAALAGLALVYVGLGQRLGRRTAEYRFPLHVYAYALALAGIIVAYSEQWALTMALYTAVAVFAALALIYRRTVETALAALVFIWPFHLSLELSPLTPHAYSLAYALLASLGYIPLGIALDRAGRKYALPEYIAGYALATYAVIASLLGRFGAYRVDVPWVGVVVPLVVAGLQVFSLYRFQRFPFAWAAVLVFSIAFGQTLTLLRVPAGYDGSAWVGLAFAHLSLERLLAGTGRRGQRLAQSWLQPLRWPLGIGAVVVCVIGLSLTAYDTLTAFTGGRVANFFPPILAQALAVGLTILGARLYRSRWPLYLEPGLAFLPVTLFFIGYPVFGRPLTLPQYGLVWSALALTHLLAAIWLDRTAARYSHGLYLGGYGLTAFAIVWTLLDRTTLLWTLGLGLMAVTGSAWLVHVNRHRTWDELISLFFGQTHNTLRVLMRGAFLWFAAWLFPAWCVLLLRQLNVADGFYWLGFGVPALLLLALAHWLRRFERTYAWPLYSAAQFYTLAGLLISAPLAAGFFAGQFKRPPENLLVLLEASGFVVLQTLAVVFYAASARVFRWRLFAYVAALLTFFPYTFAWLIYTPLESARFAWPWMAWAGALLGAGFGLDQWEKQAAPARPSGMRYAHGPYLAGYVLAVFALLWSAPDRLVNLYALAAALMLALASHALAHYNLHRSFDDFVNFFWRRRGTAAHRAARTAFLFFTAYGFPVWLAQFMTYHDVPLAWRGLGLALAAPVYVAFGLAVRRVRAEYTWPLYSAGYALTALGAMAAFDNELLAIYVLALDAVVYAASAYIFRQAFWLYLSNSLVPVIVLVTLHYNNLLLAPWVAGIFMGLAFLYFFAGQWLDRRSRSPVEGKGVTPFALPFYVPGYFLSAVALAIASGEKILAIEVYSAGAMLYALSAWALKESLFVYPAAWLAAVPYYLGMTLTILPPQWYGLGWLPLIVIYIAVGRFIFHQPPLGVKSIRTFFAALTRPAMPFYLLAYGLSVSMMALSQRDSLIFTLALAAGAVVYFASAALFRRPVWLYPALFAAHLALMASLAIRPSGRPAYYATLPFLGLTWVVAVAGYGFSRWFPVTRQAETGKLVFKFWRWELDFGSWPVLGYLITPSWSQPFFIFTTFDVVGWQLLALYGFETAIILAVGFAVLVGLFAMLWRDSALAYGALIYFFLAIAYRLAWETLPFASAMAAVGGVGLGLYLIARLAEATGRAALAVWLRPLRNAAVCLTALAVLLTLPTMATTTTASATAMAFAGALSLAIAYRGRLYRLGYVGMAMLQTAWALALIVRDVRQPQWYAIPAGLYFTGVGFLERRRGRRMFSLIVESFGLAVLLLTSFIQSLDTETGFPYFLLLLVEALLVVWWGAARRVKVPFFIGLGASALNVVGQMIVLFLGGSTLLRWLIFGGAGLLILTLAVFVERQRARIIAKAQEWLEVLEMWE